MSARQDLGKRIGTLRTQQGLSQNRLAQVANVDRTYLIGVEHGRCNASFDFMKKLADALDVTMSELFEGVGQTEKGAASAMPATPTC